MRSDCSRARLLSLLAEACELEHALCCSYLYSAFTLKRDISEGLTWEEQQVARRWASRVYHIAAQEMLHLAQAWNIMTACGGAPYYARPAFPQPAKNFPLNIGLTLRKFDGATLDRFIVYEQPEGVVLEESIASSLELWPVDETFEYSSVGALYGEISRIIRESNDPDLFLGDREFQADQEMIDFYDILPVFDRESALAAIDSITEQGEGTEIDREDSHFGVFREIREQISSSGFDPALPVADNPYLSRTVRQMLVETGSDFSENGPQITKITDDRAVHAIDLFNDVYLVMLQALAHIFASRTGSRAMRLAISRQALELMITVIKPLGEAICRMPSGHSGVAAGPSFEIARHVSFPENSEKAAIVFSGSLRQLHQRGLNLLEADINAEARAQFISAVQNLGRISHLGEHA